MDKALKLGQTSATGSFQLFVGKTVSTVALAVSTIVVGILILQSDYGLYAISLIPATTFLIFQDWGVGPAMVKYCAQYRAENEEGYLRKIIVAGLTFEVATGVALTILSLLMAPFIASTVFGKPESTSLISLVSITILFSALFGASSSIFVGFERMELSSYTMMCQAAAQSVLAPLLVYLGYGGFGAAIGYTVSIVASSIIAMVLLYFAIFRKLRPINKNQSGSSQTMKMLFRYGIPLAIASILAGISTQFYSLMIASYYNTALIGNYKIATNFAILLTFFTIPISTVLFPAFSKLDPRNEQHLLKTVFKSSVKYATVFLLPAAMAVIVLSQPLVGTIYGGKWPFAASFLALIATGYLSVIFGLLSVYNLFQAVGETKLVMKLNILTLLIGIPSAFLLANSLGLYGVLFVSIQAGAPSMFIGLYLAWKRYGATVDFRASAKILLASAIAAAVTYLLLIFLNTADWVRFAAGLVTFLAVCLTAAPLVGAINQTDINNLRAMFSGLGVISKLFEILLRIIEKLLRVRTKPAATRTQ